MRIPIVNENDEVVKIIDIDDRETGDICRVSALWVTNEKDEVLLAKRALTKRRSPGCWGPAVAGTVEEESYEENIIKEAKEEIGLDNFTPKFFSKFRRSTSHEYFVSWFTAKVDSSYAFQKQDEEVDEIRWFTKESILEMYEGNPKLFVPNFKNNIDNFISNETKN